MLKIRLSPPTIFKKKYVVFLDFETKRSFGSKREANDYITKVENELNEALLFLNEYYGIISNFYRTYFLADRDYRFKSQVENSLDLVNERLRYISLHTASTNFNTMVLQAINTGFESLSLACSFIDTKSRSRYDMLTRRRIVLFKKLIRLYQESFETFKIGSIYQVKLKVKTA